MCLLHVLYFLCHWWFDTLPVHAAQRLASVTYIIVLVYGQLCTSKIGTRTNERQDNYAPGQLGTRTIGHQDNWAPRQLGTRTIGHQDNRALDNWVPGLRANENRPGIQWGWTPERNQVFLISDRVFAIVFFF